MDYDLLLTTTASSTFQYQCQVTIQHHTEGNNTLTYGGPVTVLEKIGMILKDDDDFNLPYTELYIELHLLNQYTMGELVEND